MDGGWMQYPVVGCFCNKAVIRFPPLVEFSLSVRTYRKTGEDLEEWFSSKGKNAPKRSSGPTWHLPSDEEKAFVEELLESHLQDSLADLRIFGGDAAVTKCSGTRANYLLTDWVASPCHHHLALDFFKVWSCQL